MKTFSDKYSSAVIHGEYFPHIDGLRALAVLAVVIYHILPQFCPGGFVGVDVFFVISGYLITGNILKDLRNNQFTIGKFYHRRIRRIFPAYFVMIAGVFLVGCITYFASPLILLGDAVTSGTLFLANYYSFISSSDYFAPQQATQALLHLWSLSVEEQFYLIIPLLCMIVWKINGRWILPIFITLAVMSLAGSILTIRAGHTTSAFYMLHFRAWELLAGSILYMLPAVSGTGKRVSVIDSLASFTGLILVGVSYAIISSKTPFPGAAALAPVLGAVLLIRFGQFGVVSWLLAWRPVVFVGKISFSLYLWHWPIIVFWKYVVYDEVFWYDLAGMFIASLLLAILSWKFVEMPVRTSSFWTMRRTFLAAVAGIVLLTTIGTATVFSKGWSTVLHSKANEMAEPIEKKPFIVARIMSVVKHVNTLRGTDVRSDVESSKLGASGDVKILLIGDSNAGAIKYGFDVVLKSLGISGYALSHNGKIMFDPRTTDGQTVLSTLAKYPTIEKVVLVQYWSYHDLPVNTAQTGPLYELLENFAIQMNKMNKSLYICTDVPCRGFSPCDMAAKMKIIPPRQLNEQWEGKLDQAAYDEQLGKIDEQLAASSEKTGSILIPLHLSVKEDGFYVFISRENGKSIPLLHDNHHLSRPGAIKAAQFIMPYMLNPVSG